MLGLRRTGRRFTAGVLVLVLISLLAPAAPAIADPQPLPGYSVDDPMHGPPVAYNYPSANGLLNVPEPSAAALLNMDLQKLAAWGTKENLFQNWKIYQEQRAPNVAKPLTWEKYRKQYISLYNSNHIGTTFEQVAKGQSYFNNDNGDWRFNQRLPNSDVNRRPDALNQPELWAQGRNWLWDFKTGSVGRDQLKDFLKYCQDNHLSPGILFDSRPLAKTLKGIDKAAAEIGNELGLKQPPAIEKRFLNVAPQAQPPGTGVLASGGQKPVDGGGSETTEQSPDSPEEAVEDEWLNQLLQSQNNPQQQPAPQEQPAPQQQQPAPQPAPQQQPAPQPAPQQQQPAPQQPAPRQLPVPREQPVPRQLPAPQAPGRPGVPNLGPIPAAIINGPVAAANTWALTFGRLLAAAASGVPNVVANITGGVVGGIANGIGAGVANGVTGALPSVLGGVDFSTLQLRYISDTAYNGSGVRYAFAANTEPGAAPSFGGRANSYMASDSFFVWLALPPSAFTVNLNPNEPDRIIDAQFGRTDAGRILLEADYTMKQATAKLVDPAVPDGRRFLDALQGSKCFSPQRKWIVPLPASVAADGDSMYILDAPLDVKLEIEGTDLKPGIGCPGQDQAITRQNDDLYRATILPKIVDAVNHAPEYADLRRVYASRIAAEWYRQRSATKPTAYSKIVDSGNIDAWTSKEPWSPQELYDRYRKSFYDGDATYTWQTGDRTTWKLTIGGVDFTNIPMVNMTPKDFAKDHPTLPTTASESLFGPRFENSEQQVWLGGLTSERPMADVWKGAPSLYAPLPKSLFGTSLSPLMYAVITVPLAAWVGVGGWLWWRRRRTGFVGRR